MAMIEIAIDTALAHHAPQLTLGCICARVKITEHDDALWQAIHAYLKTLSDQLTVEDITALPTVAAQRTAYKACGKNPSRYRGSAEALLRRVAQDKGLYQVNTLVDINNLLSLETGHPVGSYDIGQLASPLLMRIGQAGELYSGIGKGDVNLENLPLLADSQGPFGSPTSDSQRAAIRMDTEHLLMVIYAFSGTAELEQAMKRATALLQHHAAAQDVKTAQIVAVSP